MKIDSPFSLKTLKHLDIGYNWIIELPEEIEKRLKYVVFLKFG